MEVPFTLTNAGFINAVLKACHPQATATKTMSSTGIILVQEEAITDWKNTHPEVEIVEWDPDCVNAQSPNMDNKGGVLLLVPSTKPVHKMMRTSNTDNEFPKTKKSCVYCVRFVDSLLLQCSPRIGHKFITTIQNIASNNTNVCCRFVLTFNKLPQKKRAEGNDSNFATAFKKLVFANEEHCIIRMTDNMQLSIPSSKKNERIRYPRDWEEALEFARNSVPTRSRKNTISRTAAKRQIFDIAVIASIHKAVQEEDEPTIN